MPVTVDTRHCPTLSLVFTTNLTPVDPVTHMMEALLPSIKSIIAAHVATLAQTSALERVPQYVDTPMAQTSALEHGMQTKPATRMRGGAPSDSLRNHTPIPSTFPEEEEEWNTTKTPKSGRVAKTREKEHRFAPLPTNPTDPLDNPFTGSLQPKAGRSGRTSTMSMRSDRSSVISSDSDEEKERRMWRNGI